MSKYNKGYEYDDPDYGDPCCQNCGSVEDVTYDTCPFSEEIHNDCEKCTCCAKCRHECYMDI